VTAPKNASTARRRSLWIGLWRCLVYRGVILNPLTDIARHIVRAAPTVVVELSNRRRESVPVIVF